jgi:hypothetical protein
VIARTASAALVLALWLALLAAPALAENGEGLVGETDDKIVTFFSLGVLCFFPLVALVLTLVEHRLEERREHREAARLRQRTGW